MWPSKRLPLWLYVSYILGLGFFNLWLPWFGFLVVKRLHNGKRRKKSHLFKHFNDIRAFWHSRLNNNTETPMLLSMWKNLEHGLMHSVRTKKFPSCAKSFIIKNNNFEKMKLISNSLNDHDQFNQFTKMHRALQTIYCSLIRNNNKKLDYSFLK